MWQVDYTLIWCTPCIVLRQYLNIVNNYGVHNTVLKGYKVHVYIIMYINKLLSCIVSIPPL